MTALRRLVPLSRTVPCSVHPSTLDVSRDGCTSDWHSNGIPHRFPTGRDSHIRRLPAQAWKGTKPRNQLQHNGSKELLSIVRPNDDRPTSARLMHPSRKLISPTPQHLRTHSLSSIYYIPRSNAEFNIPFGTDIRSDPQWHPSRNARDAGTRSHTYGGSDNGPYMIHRRPGRFSVLCLEPRSIIWRCSERKRSEKLPPKKETAKSRVSGP